MSERGNDREPIDAGLCLGCVFGRLVRSRRSVFLRCARSDFDPAYPRYPRLPVVACAGFAERPDPVESPPE